MRTHAHGRTRTRIQTHTLYRFHCNLQEVWVITTDTNKTHTYICAIVDWYIIEDKTIILTQWFCSRPTSRNVPYEVIRIWLQAQRFYYAKTCRFSTFLVNELGECPERCSFKTETETESKVCRSRYTRMIFGRIILIIDGSGCF